MLIEYDSEGNPLAVLAGEYDVNGNLVGDTIDDAATEKLMGDRTPESDRRRAYEAEADGIRDQALSYLLERDAWNAMGKAERAGAADAKATIAMADYLAKKEEIRARFPESQSDKAR